MPQRPGPAASAGRRRQGLADAGHSASTCRACPLWEHATQTVFGEGPVDAALMLVGEQPGDKEDLAGRPFVGPAGHVLDQALAAVGIVRDEVYLTNAVKHFKWKAVGKRRIHDTPRRTERVACRSWLDLELVFVDPKVVVTLGATAAQALLGSDFRLMEKRGTLIDAGGIGSVVVATIHPSFILRLPDKASRQRELQHLENDLQVALLASSGS